MDRGILDHALEYHRLGLCVIPIRAGTKEPACRSWRPFQERRPDESTLRGWFEESRDRGLAVILGDVSDGLLCRDFDDVAAFEAWATQYPRLAETLPTVETGRPGRHVYCRGDVTEIRAASKSNGAIINFGNGELRGGGYCVLPPSTHPSGHRYRWLNPLSKEVPRLDLKTSGFIPCNTESREHADGAENREIRESRENTNVLRPLCATALSLLHPDIRTAILRTLPRCGGQRHRMLFDLARELKAIPAVAEAPLLELKPFVQEWHRHALPYIRTTAFEESWFDFSDAWGKVKYPKGEGPIDRIFEQAKQMDPPERAAEYEQPELRQLVTVCRELQRASGGAPFFLSARTVSEHLGVDPSTASRWLRGLRVDRVLSLVEQGELRSRRASRYRYIGEDS